VANICWTHTFHCLRRADCTHYLPHRAHFAARRLFHHAPLRTAAPRYDRHTCSAFAPTCAHARSRTRLLTTIYTTLFCTFLARTHAHTATARCTTTTCTHLPAASPPSPHSPPACLTRCTARLPAIACLVVAIVGPHHAPLRLTVTVTTRATAAPSTTRYTTRFWVDRWIHIRIAPHHARLPSPRAPPRLTTTTLPRTTDTCTRLRARGRARAKARFIVCWHCTRDTPSFHHAAFTYHRYNTESTVYGHLHTNIWAGFTLTLRTAYHTLVLSQTLNADLTLRTSGRAGNAAVLATSYAQHFRHFCIPTLLHTPRRYTAPRTCTHTHACPTTRAHPTGTPSHEIGDGGVIGRETVAT